MSNVISSPVNIATLIHSCFCAVQKPPQPDVQSIDIQCNLLVVPTLKKLQCKDDIIENITEESYLVKQKKIPLFTLPSRILQQSKYKFINTYKHYINIDFNINQQHSKDIEKPPSSFKPGQTVDEIKHIVLRSSLMKLFTHCPSCYNTCTGEIAYV